MEKCYKLDCMCDCELEHEKCSQTMCQWRIEKLLKKEK